MVDQVLQKSLFHLDLFNSKPQIVVEKYIAPTHLGEQSTTSLSVEIDFYDCAFFKDP
jgi:hypothetical protein